VRDFIIYFLTYVVKIVDDRLFLHPFLKLKNDYLIRNRDVNEYSIVVEYYFQQKCLDDIDTMYNDLFNIKYHWCRFEFAESRGYIHSHLMTISEDSTDRHIINMKFHEPLLSPLYDLMMKMALLGTLCGDLELFERVLSDENITIQKVKVCQVFADENIAIQKVKVCQVFAADVYCFTVNGTVMVDKVVLLLDCTTP